MQLTDSSSAIELKNLDASTEKLLMAERLRLALSNNFYIYLGAVSLALVMAISHWRYNHPYIILVWLAAICAVYAARYYVCVMYQRADSGPDDSVLWLIRLYAGSLMGGTAWGIGLFILFVPDSPPLQLFLVIGLTGLSLISAMGLASQMTAAILFAIPASLLLSMRFFISGGETGFPIGASIIIGLAAFIMVSRRLQDSVVNSLKLKYQNSDLLARLEAANDRFKILADASFEGILFHDNGVVLDANKTLLKTFGYGSLKDLRGRNLMDLVAEESRPIAQQNIRAGYTEPYEITIYRGDGTLAPVEVQGKPMPYQGKTVRVVAVRSLTERVQAQKRIMESEKRLRALFENTSDIIYTHDLEGRLTSANPAFFRVTGYQWAEIEGKKIGRFLAPEFLEQAREMMKQKLEGVPETRHEIEFVAKDGRRIRVEVNTRLIMQDGCPVGVQGFGRDISERAEAERNLKNANIFLQNLIDTIPNPIFYKDINGRYTGCNTAFEKFLNKSTEEIISKTVFDLHPQDLAEVYYTMDQDLFLQGGVQVYESQVAHAGKTPSSVLFYKACYYQPDGALGGLVGVALDITDMKNTHKQMAEARQRAEQATLIKDKFVSLVAHDLRSPLGTIDNIAGVIIGKAGAGLDRTHAELLKRVSGMCGNMIHMIDNLLNITRLSTGEMILNLQVVDVWGVAVRAVEEISLTASIKGISISNPVASGEKVHADPFLISEVLRNLLVNAVKFSTKGGAVTISARNEGQLQIVEVRDTGLGVPRNILENLFRHDVKTTTLGTAGERGSGFGLPLAMDIMKAHGGTITVETEEGVGSLFTMILPQVGQEEVSMAQIMAPAHLSEKLN
ncbi:MAG: PAS domain S-box protein [Nitrospinota bacterium]|nr:PAS domain S-box protein [Nitrospinota bacterium]